MATREKIYDHTHGKLHFVASGSDEETHVVENDDELRVELEWDRHGWVGLASVNNKPIPEPFAPENGYGWYISLDREGINRLIRTLRRARDQAFGKDA